MNAIARMLPALYAGLLFLSATAFSQSHEEIPVHTLRFINEYDIPHNQEFRNTTIGGLSGIDHDTKNDVYYLISDDRSAMQAARFYKARIRFSPKGIDTVIFMCVANMRQPDGTPYPSAARDRSKTPDPESIRYNAKADALYWTSEGERIVKAGDTVLIDPSITIIKPNGEFTGTVPLPENLQMKASPKGPRQNGGLEGISFGPDLQELFATVEEPLYEDGPPADVSETSSWCRIYRFDAASGKNTAQFAYRLEPVAYPAFPANSFRINGISEILSLGGNKLLTVERSFSTGRFNCTIKVFVADLAQAENILTIPSLTTHPPAHAATKKLLLNMDNLGIFIDNIEGVTFGPVLPNGHKTLLFISDNNFIIAEKTQLLLFEIVD